LDIFLRGIKKETSADEGLANIFITYKNNPSKQTDALPDACDKKYRLCPSHILRQVSWLSFILLARLPGLLVQASDLWAFVPITVAGAAPDFNRIPFHQIFVFQMLSYYNHIL
jgi:hypothetical protein